VNELIHMRIGRMCIKVDLFTSPMWVEIIKYAPYLNFDPLLCQRSDYAYKSYKFVRVELTNFKFCINVRVELSNFKFSSILELNFQIIFFSSGCVRVELANFHGHLTNILIGI